jgi:hypothetical protein
LSNQKSFNHVIKINPIKTANATNESVYSRALSQQGRIVLLCYVIYQTDLSALLLPLQIWLRTCTRCLQQSQAGKSGMVWLLAQWE